jgi:hypothetical protein
MIKLGFTILKDVYCICRSARDSRIPDLPENTAFYSVTITANELSIVCKQSEIKLDDNIRIDRDWRIFRINGMLDLSITGIIAGISELLSEDRIPIFVISTFDTDYMLVKNENMNRAITLLQNEGHVVTLEK